MGNVEDGDVVYVYHPESSMVLTGTPNGTQLEPTPGTVEADQLTVTGDMAQLSVTVDSEGKYSFQNEAGEYLTATGFNQLAFVSDPTANGLWTLEALEDGSGFYVHNVGSSYLYLEYYDGKFTTYRTGTSAAYVFQFYAADGGGGFTDTLAAGDQVLIYNPTSSMSMSSQFASEGSDMNLAGKELILSADDKLSEYGETEIWTVGVNEDGSQYSFSTANGLYLTQKNGCTDCP